MIAAAGTPAFVWYLMRGSGLVALVLLSVTVALGVVGVKRWGSTRWPRIVTAGLHRNVSLLAVCFLAVHIITAVVDNWIGLRWFGVVVPFQSTYRPIWVGMGALTLDLLIAVMATSLCVDTSAGAPGGSCTGPPGCCGRWPWSTPWDRERTSGPGGHWGSS